MQGLAEVAAATTNPRHQLADAIAAGTGPDVVVYAYPPEVVAAPAVVVAMSTPYRTDDTYGSELWGLTLLLLVNRASDLEAMYLALDDLATAVRAAVRTLPLATWEGVQSVGPTQPVGGTEYLSADARVAWHQQ